jgi:hypothetical protein
LDHERHPSLPNICEILAERYVIRSKWKRNRDRGKVPEASKTREVIRMDSVDFGDLYVFTAIDIFSKEADVFMAPKLTALFGPESLPQEVSLSQTSYGPDDETSSTCF